MSFGPGVSRGDGDLHRFVDQRRVHPDFFRLLVLPVEALGKVRGRRRRAGRARRWNVGDTNPVLRKSRRDDEGGEDERKRASQHGLSPCEGCSIVQRARSCAPAFARSCSRWSWARRSCWRPPRRPAEPPSTILLDRAGWYLDYFVDEFENVVAEERYVQDSSAPASQLLAGHRRPRRSGRADVAVGISRARHRELRSDFLLVKSPETEALVPFRDVIDVDGVDGPRSRRAPGQAVPAASPHRRATRWRGPNGSAKKARATTSATCAARSAIRCWRSASCRRRISIGSGSRWGKRIGAPARACRSSNTRRSRRRR